MPRPNAAQIAYGSATVICSAIAMLLLSFTLYSLNQNPLLPGIIAVITIAWFLLYQYRHRNAPSYTPLDNALAWGGKG